MRLLPDISPRLPDIEPAQPSGVLAEVILLPNQPNPPRNPVIDQQPRDLGEGADTRHGHIEAEVMTLANGRRYEVVTAEPRDQRTDVPIVFTTALATSVRGHNWHTMHQAMDLGYPVVLVGPEGGKADWPKTPAAVLRLARHLASISIEETAANMHEILEITDESGIYTPGELVNIGESRASMIGMDFNAKAQRFGRHVLYGDYTGPCFPSSPETLGEYLALPGQAFGIAGSLITSPLRMPWQRALHYPETINPNPYFLLHVAATVPTLISGKAGQLAANLAPDSKIHNTHFTGDKWGKAPVWNSVFADHPYVVNTHLPGGHGSIPNEPVLQARVSRLHGLRDELEANGHQPERVDWNNVHMGGRLALAAA